MDNCGAALALAIEPIDEPISHHYLAISPITITRPLSELAISPSLVKNVLPAPPLPAEIVIEILTQLNRRALINARGVNKQFFLVATDLLFDELSLRYGIDHSVPQMTAMITSPLRFRVTSLFIPTESFFSCELSSSSLFGWTRHPFWENRVPVWWGNGHYHGEYPNIYAYKVPKSSVLLQRSYQDALLGLLDACVNLKTIHIAVSDAYYGNKEPMDEWVLLMAQKVLPNMATLRITNLKMSFPFTGVLREFLAVYEGTKRGPLQEGTDRSPVFTELKTLSLEVQTWRFSYWETQRRIHDELGLFTSDIPNLDSFELYAGAGASHSFIPKIPKALPTIGPQLKSLVMGNIYLCCNNESRSRDLKDLLVKLPSLRSLTLISCMINIPRIPEIDFLKRPKILSSEFESGNINPAESNWADIFSMISAALPNLNCFNFQRLMYGPFLTWRRLGLLVPCGGKYQKINLPRFNRIPPADHDELISPYERDHLALEQLRRTVARRNGYLVRGMAFLDTEEENVVHQLPVVDSYPVWTIL